MTVSTFDHILAQLGMQMNSFVLFV